MKLYWVDTGHTHFFATLDEAKKAAREAAADHDTEVRVDRCDIPDNKAAIIALANGVTGASETVYIAKPKARHLAGFFFCTANAGAKPDPTSATI